MRLSEYFAIFVLTSFLSAIRRSLRSSWLGRRESCPPSPFTSITKLVRMQSEKCLGVAEEMGESSNL